MSYKVRVCICKRAIPASPEAGIAETDPSIIVPRSIHSQKFLSLYGKWEKQPWHPFRFEASYATQVLSIELPGRNRHYRGAQTEWHENRKTILLLREQKRASEEHQQPFSHLCLDYGVLRRPPESNCRTATRIHAPMKAMITLPQK